MRAWHAVQRARLPQRCLGFFLALAVAVGTANAQSLPGSGELLQQAPRPLVTAPSSSTGLILQQPQAGQPDDSSPFLVRRIAITGNTLLSTSELHSLVESSEGKMLNFSYLEALAALITKHYQEHGYLLSRAYIPAQTINDGTVRIAVLEARYGAVVLTNTSKLSDALLKSYFAPLQPGQSVVEGPLERSLLLVADVPGAVVSSTLAPGAATGTSDLKVSAAPGAPYSGYAALDDAGNRYTGQTRISGAININDPLHQGDVLSVMGMTAGSDLMYGRLGYQTLLDNGFGTSVGGAVSGLYYHLGDSAADLHAHGIAQVETLTVMQPFIRSTAGNLFMQVAIDSKQLRDEIDVTDIHTDRDTNALTLTLAGDRRDAGGISNMNLSLSVADLSFENAAAESADAVAARTRGVYDKFTLSVARLQSLSASNSLYVALNGQLANKNLDSSEQIFLGGPNSVRAYDVGTVGGAQGGLASVELRHNFDVRSTGAWQGIAFVDSGIVQIYKDPLGPGENRATLSGAGVGLNWIGPKGWTATAAVATPIGGTPALAGDTSSTRLWVEVRKAFLGKPKSQ
jgi:hemolysin activation/secretion protein